MENVLNPEKAFTTAIESSDTHKSFQSCEREVKMDEGEE